MARETHKAIGGILAACVLSGCALGPREVPRDSAGRPKLAPVATATPRPVQTAPTPRAPPAVRAAEAPAPEKGWVVPVPTTPPAPAPPPAPTSRAIVEMHGEMPQLANIVHFGTDAYLPDADADALLRAHAEQLKADPRRRLLLKGHGDARGTPHYNRALAAKRAEMVAKALRAHGVDASQLSQIAIGDDRDPDGPDVRRVVLIYR